MNKKNKQKNNLDPFENLVLDRYEQEIEDSVEKGEWVSVSNLEEEKNRLAEIAKNTVAKRESVNFRISKRDLMRLKSKALEEGLPYQTLISSILHKFVSGKLINSDNL